MIIEPNYQTLGIPTSLSDTLNRAFVSAYLVTKNARQAEEAVLNAIDRWESGENDEQKLIETAVSLASQMRAITPSAECCEGGRLNNCLPVELRRVMALPADLRRCFVLRTLVGIPAQLCAEAMCLTVSQVDAANCEAMKALAELDRKTTHAGAK